MNNLYRTLAQSKFNSCRLCEGADIRVMKLKEVTNTTGLPRSSIYAYMSKGKFPKPSMMFNYYNSGAERHIGVKDAIGRFIAGQREVC